MKTEDDVPVDRSKEKNMKKIFLFASFKSMRKEVGSGYISQRYGSGDPDPHQNVTDPQHWIIGHHPAANTDWKTALLKECRRDHGTFQHFMPRVVLNII